MASVFTHCMYYDNDAGTRAGGGVSAEGMAWPQSPPTADIATYCTGSPTLYDGHIASPPSYRQSTLSLLVDSLSSPPIDSI